MIFTMLRVLCGSELACWGMTATMPYLKKAAVKVVKG